MAGSDQDNRARAETDKVDGGPTRVRLGFRRAQLVAGRTPERLARAGANTMLVDREGHGWPGAIRMVEFELDYTRKWWAHQDLNLGPIDYESTALTN